MTTGTRWHHSILVRTAVSVIGMALIVGALFIGRAAIVIGERSQQHSNTTLRELLDTVERTVSIACFVQDGALASEVAGGLLKNSSVLGVVIVTDGKELSRVFRDQASPLEISEATQKRLVRPIYAPFSADQKVGEIELYPNARQSALDVREEVLFFAVLLAMLLGAVVASIVVVVMRSIIRPIKGMSDYLHRMDATAGDRLRRPRGHTHTEVGRLAEDINSLADRLVTSLDDEHRLRLRHEIDERKYRGIFDTAETGIFIANRAGRIESANPSLVRLCGLGADGLARGEAIHIGDLTWQDPNVPLELIAACLSNNLVGEEDLALALSGDRIRWLNLVLTAIGDDMVQGLVTDVTERKLAEELARTQAVTDPLTGLANRSGFVQCLKSLIDRATDESTDKHFTLMHINLDAFRRINEALGLPVGDRVLKIAAERLRNSLKPTDTIARLGSDSFAVILPGVTTEKGAARIAERLVAALAQHYDVDSTPVKLSASIGIAMFSADGQDSPTLLLSAELALGRAKTTGGSRHSFFDQGMADAAEQRRAMETDMQLALRRGEFRLFYQPIIDLASNRLVGAEALIRWLHPVNGMVPPDAFIPLAEECGLIVDIGMWALDTACRQLATWQAQGKEWYVSLNVSGRQIPDGLPPSALADATQRYGIDPARLVLEITEGVLMKDVSLAQDWLSRVRSMGCRVYLDDFGTGYSSLSYLKRFPVDTVKVDKSFVRDMANDSSDRALVEAVVVMARSLGMQVVAEGVEEVAQLELLRQMNCRSVQGFYFSRPVPAGEFDATAARIATLLENTQGRRDIAVATI